MVTDNGTKQQFGLNSSALISNSSAANASDDLHQQQTAVAQPEAFPGWAVLLIVAASIAIILGLIIGGYFVAKRVRDRRKNHGEYKPQQVEHMQAKDLPYITPPNIEGLI